MTTFNIYRRNSDDNSSNMVKIASGLTSISYTDTSTEVGNTYFYSIGVVKNGHEKISDPIMIVVEIGEPLGFIESIYAIGEYVNLTAKLSNGDEIVSVSVINGSLPDGWVLNGLSISGKATTQGVNEFTLQIEDSFRHITQKTFSVKIQGRVWSQLTFDNRDMVDLVDGNTWTLGVNNTFVEGIDSPYALKLGGTSHPVMNKTFSQSQNFSIFADVIVHSVGYSTFDGILYMGSISSNNNRENLYIGDGEIRSYRQAGTGTGVTLRSGVMVEVGSRYKIGYVKNGNSRKIFVNGVLVASDSYSNSVSSSSNIYIGANRLDGNPQYSTLTIDNLVVTTGEPRFE